MWRNSRKLSVLVGMILLGCQSVANDEDGAAIGVRHDRDALVTLYHATGGPGWARRENWLSDEPLGTWHGVETNDAGRVVHLELAENKLVGPIPRELAGLTEIVHLSLRGNQLTGSIPPELGTLAQLNHLDLYINNLNGRIPPELAELPNLTQLLLGFNRFTGPIPREIGSMPRLERVWLNHNQLAGPVPPELGNFGVQLEWLDVQRNEGLAGPLPMELLQLTNLHRFEWSSTGLCSPTDDALQVWLSQTPNRYGRGEVCSPGIWVWPTTFRLDAPKDTVQLGLSLIGPDGMRVKNPSVDWSSSDASVATVDGSGLVTAVASGYASITATVDGAARSVSIAVGP